MLLPLNENVAEAVRRGRLRWFEHVGRKDEGEWVSVWGLHLLRHHRGGGVRGLVTFCDGGGGVRGTGDVTSVFFKVYF